MRLCKNPAWFKKQGKVFKNSNRLHNLSTVGDVHLLHSKKTVARQYCMLRDMDRTYHRNNILLTPHDSSSKNNNPVLQPGTSGTAKSTNKDSSKWKPESSGSHNSRAITHSNLNAQPQYVVNPINLFTNMQYTAFGSSVPNQGQYLNNGWFSHLQRVPVLEPNLGLRRAFSDTTVLQTNFRRSGTQGWKSCDVAKKRSSGKSKERERPLMDRLRTWHMTNFGKKLEGSDGGKVPGTVINVVSYNVLAQDLVDEHQYLYHEHNHKALLWEFRWSNLLYEIHYLDPDIMCLQEVQGSHLKNYYEPALKDLGYTGLYKQRTGIRTDGCAIYYKTSLFKLIEHVSVEFLQPNMSVLNRDNVAIIAKFAPLNNESAEFIVATTHLLYNPNRQDVRVAQTQILLTELERMAFKRPTGTDSSSYIPIILTGDFNSTPDSAVVELIECGQLDYQNLTPRTLQKTETDNKMGKFLLPPILRVNDNCQHAELTRKRQFEDLTREEEEELVKIHHSERKFVPVADPANMSTVGFSTGMLQHNFALKSAYRFKVGNESEATTYQNRWITVDYIFYSGMKDEKTGGFKEDKLKLLARYSLPTGRQLGNLKLPNFALGSDHLSLMAKFKLEYR